MFNFIGSSGLTKIFELIKSKFNSLATVATSGSYNDLSDTPTIVRASTEVIGEVSSITIPFNITDTNSLSVYQNGVLLTPNTHYTATTTTITLNNYTTKSGDVFTFISTSLAGVSINPSAANVTIMDSDANFTGVTTVEGALKYIADNWKPLIQTISVNGTVINPVNGVINITTEDVPVKSISLNSSIISPDETGNVNLSITVPIKSISLYSSTITPDSSGNVNINGLVKSLSLNGTSYSPDSTGVLSLSNVMKNNVNQTMTAMLVAQNNTNYTTKQVRNIFLIPKSTLDSGGSLPTGSSGDICIVYKDS